MPTPASNSAVVAPYGVVLARGVQSDIRARCCPLCRWSCCCGRPRWPSNRRPSLPTHRRPPIAARESRDSSAATPARRGRSGSAAGRAAESGETSVFGSRGIGTKFVYVFDRSNSMNDFEGRPLAGAKRELLASLERS